MNMDALREIVEIKKLRVWNHPMTSFYIIFSVVPKGYKSNNQSPIMIDNALHYYSAVHCPNF